jgi:hypothetical protein
MRPHCAAVVQDDCDWLAALQARGEALAEDLAGEGGRGVQQGYKRAGAAELGTPQP